MQKPCELDRLLEVLTDAYKKRVMNKMQVPEQRMEEILKKAAVDSPLSILRRLREYEQEGEKKAWRHISAFLPSLERS